MKKVYLLLASLLAFISISYSQKNYVLFGQAQNGGTSGNGTLFQYNLKSGMTTSPVNFSDSNGNYPQYGTLTLDSATGMLLGTTYEGGSSNLGTIFSYGSCSGEQVLLNMKSNAPEGSFPYGNLTYDKTTGLFYGLTDDGGQYNLGALFSFNPLNSKFVLIYSFKQTTGTYPQGTLTWNPNTNLFYGLASNGGANDEGGIFSFDPGTGSVTFMHTFSYADGAYPYNSLMYNAVDKLLYGMAYEGGTSGSGVLFSFDPSTNKDSTLFSFNNTNGAYPENNVLFNPLDSLLYGFTYEGGTNGIGVIFSFNPKTGQDSVRVIMNNTNGAYGTGSLTFNPNDSLLYGMTAQGGTGSSGILFSFNPRNNKDSVLVSFTGTNGANPYGDLLLDTAKDLFYGITQNGGINGFGVAFVYNVKTNTDSTIINFNDTNGAYPYASFTKLNGILYTMADESELLGNPDGPGVITSYNPATGKDSVLHNFVYTAEENYSENVHLTYYHANGKYYGVSYEGGLYNVGTIYSFDPVTKKDSVVFNFNDSLGEYPYGGLTLCPANGLLYGSAEEGGIHGVGVIYKFNPLTGVVTLVSNLNNVTGSYAIASLTYCPANGLMYGTTENGGANTYGVIYSIDPATDTYTDVLDFGGVPIDGQYPEASLTYNAGNGMFYGTTYQGGTANFGCVFMFNPITGKDSLLVNFNAANGQYEASGVTIDPSDSIFYGVAPNGGIHGYGVIYMYNINSGKDSVLYSFDGLTGSAPICDLLLVNVTPPAFTVSKDTTICSGYNLTLNANTSGPGAGYSWSTGATTSSVSVTPTSATTYSVTVCQGIYNVDTSVTVNVNPSPTLAVTGRDTIISGDVDTLGASGAVSYVWNPGSLLTDSVMVSPSATTVYTVTGTAANGCTSTATFTVVVNTITGIQTVSQGSASVYPNPAKQTMYLTFSMKGSADATIQIMNVYGEVVLNENTTISNGETMPFDISNLSTGVYFAHIVANNQTQVVKFVKQ